MLDVVDPGLAAYRYALRESDRLALRKAPRIIVNSEFTCNNVRTIYDKEASVCYHGIDTQRFRPDGTSRGGFLLSVGALVPHKGFDFLIEAIGLLPMSSRPPLQLVCNYVEQREGDYLRAVADRCGVRLSVQVGISDDTLVELYSSASAVVYAPHREPFGLVPLEAMACEAPVVAVSEGGVRETVVHGETGFLVPRDREAFARAISTLLVNRKLSADLGIEGRRVAKTRWTWESAIQSLEGHLYEVASAR